MHQKQKNTEINILDLLLLIISIVLFNIHQFRRSNDNTYHVKEVNYFSGIIHNITDAESYKSRYMINNEQYCKTGYKQYAELYAIYNVTYKNTEEIAKRLSLLHSSWKPSIIKNLITINKSFSWLRIDKLLTQTYKFKMIDNKVREIRIMHELFVKTNPLNSSLFNVAYVKFTLTKKNNSKFGNELKDKLQPIIMEDQYSSIANACFLRKNTHTFNEFVRNYELKHVLNL